METKSCIISLRLFMNNAIDYEVQYEYSTHFYKLSPSNESVRSKYGTSTCPVYKICSDCPDVHAKEYVGIFLLICCVFIYTPASLFQ